MNNIEDFYKKSVRVEDDTISFQTLDWNETNEAEDEYEDKPLEKYTIKVFGVDKNKNSVYLCIKNFTPFFFIKVPDTWNTQTSNDFLERAGQAVFKTKYGWVNISNHILFKQCKILMKKDFYGFRGNKEFKFLRIVFDNSNAMRRMINVISKHNSEDKSILGYKSVKFQLYETKIDPFLRFIHLRTLKPSGWIQVKNFNVINNSNLKESNCQIEITSDWKNITPIDNDISAPILQASYDIEVFNEDKSFDPNVDENVVTHIATSFKYFGSKDVLFKHIICLKQHKDIQTEDTTPLFMECYNTEKEVLLAWNRLITKTDPDIIYHYNGDWFDGHYLVSRSKKVGCSTEFLKIGKLKNIPGEIKEAMFESSAYGSNKYRRFIMPGRINFDILIFIKREYKEISYKLDDISQKYLGENKNPITPQMMFDYFKQGDPELLSEVAKYAIQDTLLPQKLVDKMCILQSQIAMSNITYVPIKYLIERGQSIKVFSQIIKETSKRNFLIPTLEFKQDDDEKFKGAYVLTPEKGAYSEPITVVDFASLYPSIIRAHNFCFSTLVMDETYNNLPNFEYSTISWEEPEKKYSYTYVQNVPGILPDLLAELTTSRKNYKKLMANTEEPFLKDVYNRCQLAVKVSMNSIYGFLGAPMLRCKAMASSVTAVGRDMIDSTKKYAEENYPKTKVVYGDSVTGDTPLLLRNKDTLQVTIKTIESLCEIWDNYEEFKPFDTYISNRTEKQQGITDFEVWCENGWNPIKRVIRHKCNKRIFRVNTHYGCVDVTEDHSLINSEGNVVKPSECSVGDVLLESYPTEFPTIKLNEWKNKRKPTKKMGKLMRDTYDGNNNLFCDTIVPDTILNESFKIRRVFFEGYCDRRHFIMKDKKSTALIYYLASSLGFNPTVNVTNDSYDLRHSEDESIKNEIKKIIDLGETNDYVYDLETEKGTFNGGIGRCILKNTDSCFVRFETESTNEYLKELKKSDNPELVSQLKIKCLSESISLGKDLAENATKALFKFPIQLEYEKTFSPFILLSKKRYIGKLYEKNPEKYEAVKNSGIVLTRRDNFPLVKEVYKTILDLLVENTEGIDKTIEKVRDYIQNIVSELENGSIPLESLVISKSLRSDYKNVNIPHVALARKIQERDPGNAYKSNDRVPYIFIAPYLVPESNNGKRKIAQYLKVEDPDYATKHSLPLDTVYYVEFLKKPICELLEAFTDNPEEFFKKN